MTLKHFFAGNTQKQLQNQGEHYTWVNTVYNLYFKESDDRSRPCCRVCLILNGPSSITKDYKIHFCKLNKVPAITSMFNILIILF